MDAAIDVATEFGKVPGGRSYLIAIASLDDDLLAMTPAQARECRGDRAEDFARRRRI